MPDQGTIVELTILMPCLNEAETLGGCIDQARDFLTRAAHRRRGSDRRQRQHRRLGRIAEAHGARVVHVAPKGYGAALMRRDARRRAARYRDHGRLLIGATTSAGSSHFVERLRAGYDLVMGNRFLGGITRGAMPLAAPVLWAIRS